LVVHGSRWGRIVPVGRWTQGIPITWNGGMAFSSDSSVLAVEMGHGAIQFIDPATGLERARFEDPSQDKAEWLAFSPDDTRLVTSSNDGKAVHIWDLRLIRTRLAMLGLDWGTQPFVGMDAAPARLNGQLCVRLDLESLRPQMKGRWLVGLRNPLNERKDPGP